MLIGGPSQLQLYQQLSHHDFRQLVTHECYIIHMYKARARSNGYRMFISVYILCTSAYIEFKASYVSDSMLCHVVSNNMGSIFLSTNPIFTHWDGSLG